MDCMVLCEAVAASLGEWNAKPALAPEFSLRDLEELKVVVVPVELTYRNISRALKERTVKLQIGFMKRAKKEQLDELLATVEKLGMSFSGKEFCGAKCIAVGFNPIYAADQLRERNQFMAGDSSETTRSSFPTRSGPTESALAGDSSETTRSSFLTRSGPTESAPGRRFVRRQRQTETQAAKGKKHEQTGERKLVVASPHPKNGNKFGKSLISQFMGVPAAFSTCFLSRRSES